MAIRKVLGLETPSEQSIWCPGGFEKAVPTQEVNYLAWLHGSSSGIAVVLISPQPQRGVKI